MIRIKLSINESEHKNSLLTYIKLNFNIVNEKEDITLLTLSSDKGLFCTDSRVLIICGENIFYKERFGWGLFRKFDKINHLLVRFLPYNTPYYFIHSLLKKENMYFIMCNDIKAKNVLNFPYFFNTHFDKFQNLINIKKRNLYASMKKKFCAFMVTNTSSMDRIDFYQKLSKYKKIDSFGSVLNNSKIPIRLLRKYTTNGKEPSSNRFNLTSYHMINQELFREYKFVICFENSYVNDYVTEKLPNVMMANSIGIYRGAKNINEFFNTKSFINYDDYGSYDNMIQRIIELDQDDKKYQQVLAEPFFLNNELPPRIKTAKQDLKSFIEKIFIS